MALHAWMKSGRTEDKLLLEQGRLSVQVVAKEAGFGDRERMRRAFLRGFGQPPHALRKSTGSVTAWWNLMVISPCRKADEHLSSRPVLNQDQRKSG
jgi:AraC-like DNA-binding protein